ncbi:MAG: Gldg family protein [Halioglobus sp.]
MATDSVVRRVAQKELRLFFSSTVAWLFLAGFAAVTLFTFFWVESFFARNIADVRPLFEWMPLLLIFLCAALTMRMWSEERRSGTLEHVLTQPAGVWRFVLGKFLACLTLLVLAVVSTLCVPLTVYLIADLDVGPALTGYLATVLLGAAYLAIGLFSSARTDNPIVSLIGTVSLCGLLYLLGSPALTVFLDDRSGDLLRLLGSGARFDSIARGVIDLRDLFYYASLVLGFLALNVYALERERFARGAASPRHRRRRNVLLLLIANLLLANVWLSQLSALRIDTTQGRLYSLSDTTRSVLDMLEEPLLIRAYFSARTHPALAPLVPQLRDLLREYALAGGGRVQVEFIDPEQAPALEEEANKRYGIRATPFQVADRHQTALVNAYFNLLVRYGSEHQTLGFSDLIEVRTAANQPAEVLLRNPEYDITHAIKKVFSDYRMGGNLFDGVEEPVEFIAYVSPDEKLPAQLRAYRTAIQAVLENAVSGSNGKFSLRFIDPEARGGEVARQIAQEWGFRPMIAALDDQSAFYFYMTLADSRQVVHLPTEDFDADSFRLLLDTGLKRFTRNFTRTVALALPSRSDSQAPGPSGGFADNAPQFSHLERTIASNYNIQLEDLDDGSVSPEADILAVLAPLALAEAAVYAIDQFLMRGGTVVLVTSPYTVEASEGQLRLTDWISGLNDWLIHNGLRIGETLVLDTQHTAFPAPVVRRSGDYEFRDMRMLDYPYFVDIRPPGLSPAHPVTAGMRHLTMAWASPITVAANTGRRSIPLLQSSPAAWLSDSMDIMPRVDAAGAPDVSAEAGLRDVHTLGLVMQGRFDSYFAELEQPPGDYSGAESPNRVPRGAPLRRSPESARIILFASNDFMDDQVLSSIVTASGTQYLGPLELFGNTLDWALQDEQLLAIRSRGHFNRTLPPMEKNAQRALEYLNYAAALLWLALLALLGAVLRYARRRHYARALQS